MQNPNILRVSYFLLRSVFQGFLNNLSCTVFLASTQISTPAFSLSSMAESSTLSGLVSFFFILYSKSSSIFSIVLSSQHPHKFPPQLSQCHVWQHHKHSSYFLFNSFFKYFINNFDCNCTSTSTPFSTQSLSIPYLEAS